MASPAGHAMGDTGKRGLAMARAEGVLPSNREQCAGDKDHRQALQVPLAAATLLSCLGVFTDRTPSECGFPLVLLGGSGEND